MLLHRPTRLQVKCQTTRHQGLNRFIARRLLLDKIEKLQTGQVSAERARIEKIRRQKRKRSRGAKERMLADKSRHADKKAARRAVGDGWS
jgi:protein subunit release factor B